ncbi:hypothetical protein HPP92_015533 [Vanilla planifolia]|uniref:Uncharacterized protein n=1 Tax=Vanilla planifolia TaxID=51239 RepID=A0A835QLC0_VANPL|nr:hypothetical protein HPP92_016147 [Vanilla planifolia]KAG0470987.1 hypothetical protein HPP92_015533 [Vanilla planifolia]
MLQVASRASTSNKSGLMRSICWGIYINDLLRLHFVLTVILGKWILCNNSARFLWKSIQIGSKRKQAEVVAAWKIGQCLWNRDFAGFIVPSVHFEWSQEALDLCPFKIKQFHGGKGLRWVKMKEDSEKMPFNVVGGWILCWNAGGGEAKGDLRAELDSANCSGLLNTNTLKPKKDGPDHNNGGYSILLPQQSIMKRIEMNYDPSGKTLAKEDPEL